MSIWQTEEWQLMLKKSKQVSDFFNISGVFVEKREVAIGKYGLFILGLDKSSMSNSLLDELIDLTKKEESLFLQIETLNYSSDNNSELIYFKRGFYKKFITPYTAIIDLTLSEDEILSKMKPKGRYNIKLATKKGVEVNVVEKTSDNIKEYYDLMLETTSRDNFSGNSLDYYITFLNELENSKLLLAYKDGFVIAGGIFTFDKEVSIYYYGASTSKKGYRNLMAPYLLQWEAIKIAKRQNSNIFDFLGVSSPGVVGDSLSGVTSFKNKLTPDILKVSEGYIYINKKFTYILIQILRKIKSIIK